MNTRVAPNCYQSSKKILELLSLPYLATTLLDGLLIFLSCLKYSATSILLFYFPYKFLSFGCMPFAQQANGRSSSVQAVTVRGSQGLFLQKLKHSRLLQLVKSKFQAPQLQLRFVCYYCSFPVLFELLSFISGEVLNLKGLSYSIYLGLVNKIFSAWCCQR